MGKYGGIFAAAVLCAALLTGCAAIALRPELIGCDAPAAAGRPVTIRAKLQGPGALVFKPDLHGRAVEFYDGDRLLGSALTGRDGIASLECAFDEAGYHRVSVSRPGAENTAPTALRVYAQGNGRPFLVIDIDNTLCRTRLLGAMFLNASHRVPARGAAETLRALSDRYEFIYLTGRDDSEINVTRRWLRDRGFPHGLILARDLKLATLSSERFKTAALAELLRLSFRIRAGIGNRDEDARALMANGIPAILFHSRERELKRTFFVKKWTEVAAALDGLDGIEAVSER